MPNTAQEIKEKQFITNILNNQGGLTLTHLLNGDKLKYDPTDLEAPEFPKSLSKEQTDTATSMATEWLTLLLGVPGAGKTQTVATTIKTLQEARNIEKVLVIAPTNNACRNLVKAMTKPGHKVTGLRWYTAKSHAATRPKMYEKTLDSMIQRLCRLRPEIDNPKGIEKMKKEILHEGRVIVCTPDMAQKQDIIDIEFDLIVFDEAGIASGTNLSKGFLRYKIGKKPSSHNQARILIAGDEHQLKPYKYEEYDTPSPLQTMAESLITNTI